MKKRSEHFRIGRKLPWVMTAALLIAWAVPGAAAQALPGQIVYKALAVNREAPAGTTASEEIASADESGASAGGGTSAKAASSDSAASSGPEGAIETASAKKNVLSAGTEAAAEAAAETAAESGTSSLEGPEIATPHAAVMEVSTGTMLYEKDSDVRVHPASVTKIMTVLLVMEAIDRGELSLSDEVVTSAYAKSMGGSQVYLEEGETQTVETLLKCILIASGNDAAVAMAEKIGGTEDAFVEKMNARAQELGMENTHFADCCGLTDSADHYTSARDVAIVSRELLLNHPEITEYSGIWMEDIIHVTAQGSKPFTLSNTNKLLRAYDGCDGLKTGSTSIAKYCLSATAMRDGVRLVSVVLTAPDSKTRFSDAAKLLNYGFSRCSLYEDTETPVLPKISVRGSIQELFTVYLSGTFSYLCTSGEDFSDIEKHLEWKEDLTAPLSKDDEAGAYVYTLNGREIGRVPVLLAEDVLKAGYADYLNQAWHAWLLEK